MLHSSEILPTSTIRTNFPALERTHNGTPVAYFDGPGGTQVPRVVADAMVQYLFHHNANTHWAYPTSNETDQLLYEARCTLADFLNATPDTIVFGQNMTSLTFHVARALGRKWSAGDEIIVTDLDHHANIDPWVDLARERNLHVRHVSFDTETGQLDWNRLENFTTSKTVLIAIGGSSNALGTINDITRITKLAREAGALSFIDAVHYAPHVLCDVKALKCDFLACSPYKFYGPHAGVLYGRGELLSALDMPRLAPAPSAAPERLETGTLSHEAIVGSAAAVDYLASLSGNGKCRTCLEITYDVLHMRMSELFKTLWDGLEQIKGVHCYGPTPEAPRTPVIGFTVQGFSSEEVCRQLSKQGLFLSHGDFYATTVIQRLGVEGLVRAGCACYTTQDEIHRLIEGVDALAID